MNALPGVLEAPAAAFARKLRMHLPVPWRSAAIPCAVEDWLRSRPALRRDRMRRVEDALRACDGPEDLFDLASRVIPSHQIRSEITGFLRFAAAERPRVVCEIGTAEGGTNLLLGRGLSTAEQVIGLDLFVWNRRVLRRLHRPETQIDYLVGSSHEDRTREHLRSAIGDRQIDLLFIDGDHTYAGVAQDFEMYRTLVRPGGLIAFHDVVPDYLTRYGRRTGRWAGGVPAFWAEVRQSFEHREFVEDPEQDGLGIGVIRYDPRLPWPRRSPS